MPDAYDNLPREELRRLAEERGIEVRVGMTRARILSLLRDARAGADAAHGDPPAASGSDDAQMEAARSKFDLRPDGEAPAPHDIPWGYGETRITAMARDPEFIYVYWEATDEALAAARAALGPGGPGAFCVLRVYDTTHRHFDGTNANSYFDISVDRSWNSFFFRVDRPTATFHVDLGLKSHEGFFAVMARSGPAEMPASGMSVDGRVEWMTVQPQQQMPGPSSYRHRYVPRPAPPWVGRPGSSHGETMAVGSWTSAGSGSAWEVDFERVLASLVGGEAAQQGEWFEQIMGGRVVRWIRWTGGRRKFTWRTGDAGAALPAGLYGPIEVWFEGRRHVLQSGAATEEGVRYEFGPWYVVIAGSGPQGERRVFDTWVVRVAWSAGGGMERIETPMIYRRILGAYRRRVIVAGGSEMLIREEMGASEELMAGSSERLWLAASESLMAGASETLLLGASERLGIGASERHWGGASGIVWGGASEFAFVGASERSFGGASEELPGGSSFLGGASERLQSGASEGVVGFSRGEGWSGCAVVPEPGASGRGTDVAVADVLPRVLEAARQIQGGDVAETGTRGKTGTPPAPEPAGVPMKSPAAKGGRDRFAARQLDLFESTGRSDETAARGTTKPSRPAVAAVPPARSPREAARPAPKANAVKRAAPAPKARAAKRAAPARTAKRSKAAVRPPARKKAPSRTTRVAPAKRRGPASKRRR